ncbi:MAG: iron-sulfur cluster repair di-iron protein [Raineya sp.]
MLASNSIAAIVEQNYTNAFLLYSLGIDFFLMEEKTLQEVCADYNLDMGYVLRLLKENTPQQVHSDIRKLKKASIETILTYLKHQHTIFLQKKIPFVAYLIEKLSKKDASNNQLIVDLQLMFPLFAEDFIHHIHEEEDTFFYYISTLLKSSPQKIYELQQKFSIQSFALAHDTHDDEMQGIRQLTRNYQLPLGASLHLKVVYWNLEELEKQLQMHAYIENEILFPKVLVLENKIKSEWIEQSKWN